MTSRKQRKKRSTGRDRNLQARARTKHYRLWWTAAGLAVLVILILMSVKGHFLKSRSGDLIAATSAEKPDFQSLLGDWVRPDGGYVIKIRSIDPDGELVAGYYNPRPINVSRALASAEKGKINVFIKLRDKGYPGSTYNLVYHEENEALFGIYYQAVMDQSFDVAFVRK